MKKRLLFVDDEPMVLQGLQRLLRPLREEWEMEFAGSGESALAHTAAAHYDVVITDMMMPGRDGAEFLARVREHSPKTVRLILSGHTSPELSMKCVGLAHQFLSKPCDAGTLRATLARVTQDSFAEGSARIMELVVQLEDLPSLPSIFCEIVRLLKNPEASLEEAGALIARDIALTAKLLKIVNSSFFGLAQRASRPAEAAAYLGLETLKAIILATSVFGQFEGKETPGFSPTDAAEHSQRVGTLARALARAEGASRTVCDDALTAGFLHEVGTLILASNLPEDFQRLARSAAGTPLEAEREVFGATHAEVGGYLLGLWGLPPPVVEAISQHHAPGATPNPNFSALTAVHIASVLLAGDAPAAATLDLDYLTRLGIAEHRPAWDAAADELLAAPAH